MKKEILTHLKSISNRLKQEYHAQKVVLYGSCAKGEETPDSDVDLFIVVNTNENFFNRIAHVKGIIRDIRNGLAISPIVLSPEELEKRIEIGDVFINEILEKGISL